jgi:hypothetical protein
MNDGIYHFTFGPSVPLDEAEETLQLALIAAEALHGQPQVRLGAGYYMDPAKRGCAVNANSPAGRDVCRIFTGFLTHEFGESAFTVRRAEAKAEHALAEVGR